MIYLYLEDLVRTKSCKYGGVMQNNINNLIDDLVDGGSNFVASLGINRVAGQLYMLLFFSPKALSLDDMTKALKVSKGHVSTNIRALERWQAVRKLWVKGTRKDYYEANTDTINIISTQLKYGLNKRINEFDLVIDHVKIKMKNLDSGDISKDESAYIYNRLKQVEDMHKKVSNVLSKLELLSFIK